VAGQGVLSDDVDEVLQGDVRQTSGAGPETNNKFAELTRMTG
jgi:hypothetical protein